MYLCNENDNIRFTLCKESNQFKIRKDLKENGEITFR